MIKKYQLLDKNSIRKGLSLNVNGKSTLIEFVDKRKSGHLFFTTDNKHVMGAIETSPYFKSWGISIVETIKEEGDDALEEDKENSASTNCLSGNDCQDNENSAKVHEVLGIKTFPEARQWLMSNANVPHQRLNNDNAILNQASLAGVSFPDLVVETE